MNYRPSKFFVGSVLLLGATAAGMGYVGSKAAYCRENGVYPETLKEILDWKPKEREPSLTPEQIKARAKVINGVWERELEKHHELRTKPVDLSDEDNAMVALQRESPPLKNGLLDNRVPWEVDALCNADPDVEKIASYLASHREQLELAKEIASKKGAGMADFESLFLSFGKAATCARFLMLESWLHALEGDQEASLASARLCERLEGLLEECINADNTVENARFAVERVQQGFVLSQILPALSENIDWDAWDQLVRPGDYSVERYASILLSDADESRKHWLPLTAGQCSDEVAAAFVPVFANRYVELANRYRAVSLREMAEGLDVPALDFSLEGLEKFRNHFLTQEGNWGKIYASKAVGSYRRYAAIGLFRREQAGEEFTGTVETEVLNPVTDRPYLFDSETREVRLDEEATMLVENAPHLVVPGMRE